MSTVQPYPTIVDFDLEEASADDLALAKWVHDYDDPNAVITYENQQELTRMDYLWVVNCAKALIANGKITYDTNSDTVVMKP